MGFVTFSALGFVLAGCASVNEPNQPETTSTASGGGFVRPDSPGEMGDVDPYEGLMGAEPSDDEVPQPLTRPIGQTRQLIGLIVLLRQPEGASRDVVAKILSTEGEEYLVNLGPPSGLRGLGIDEGLQVTIFGPFYLHDGKNLIIAEHVRVDGKSLDIRR
jgi:hypothetical protein